MATSDVGGDREKSPELNADDENILLEAFQKLGTKPKIKDSKDLKEWMASYLGGSIKTEIKETNENQNQIPATSQANADGQPHSQPTRPEGEAPYDVWKYEEKKKKPIKTEVKEEKDSQTKKTKKGDEPEVWKWWEEESCDDCKMWYFLEHKGVVFAPEYEPLPDNVLFYYDGKKMKLSPETEEVATFYGRMLDHDYTTKEVFKNNFFTDWHKIMTPQEKKIITDLRKCNFKEIDIYFKKKTEERKAMTKEQKQVIKKQNEEMLNEYGFCTMDGHKEKIDNFRIEPPGLFRGHGDHPKQGMYKKRTMPEDVIINCSKDSKIPQPPSGHKWKEVRHDNTVSWLASWTENIQGQTKYVMLNAASRFMQEKDRQKCETARNLYRCVDSIREGYRNDWKSKEMRVRQRAVALYLIDKFGAGNEKEEGETADIMNCCSLRVEHLKLHEDYDGQENVVEFDFLGKDSIRYYNRVTVEKQVFKNLQLFFRNKLDEDDLFDRLTTKSMNKHLHEQMEGLTAKVFCTFNASKTLQEQLKLLTVPDDPIPAKLLSYNCANRAVAVLCNHQCAAPKNFDKQMENMQIKDENKEIALGTSKLNYSDPRISVSWCKKWEVPIEKVYNKTQRDKFRWAIDMADETFVF